MYRKIMFYCIILSSIFSCEKVRIHKNYTEIKTAAGPEDIVLDEKNNRILVSCTERRVGKPELGEIYSVNISTDKSELLPRINFPSIPFYPHGFDLQTINGISYLYVINHYNDGSGISSVIQFKINKDNLEFLKEYKNNLLISPNDLTVLTDGSFYFTNDRNSLDILELITNPKAGSLVYCDGNNNWKKADSLIGFPNGLFNENGKLYLSTSRNFALYTYEINEDGSLSNKKILSNVNGMDNICNNGNELIVAVHPDEIKFALLTYLPDNLSPSRTYSINKTTGASKVIFNDNGSLISGSSTALIHGKALYLSQVFGEFILKIDNYDD